MFYHVSASVFKLNRSFAAQQCFPLLRRSMLTHIEEPDLTSLVPERPCTVVLAEEEGFYPSSWTSWRSSFVQEHGFSFAQLQLVESSDLDSALRELSRDISSLIATNCVLISRGPMMSSLAQFYLESLPLAGLVMVDPLPLDNTESVKALERHYAEQTVVPIASLLFNDYVEHYAHWTMKLEPGSVPMMIIMTQNDNKIYANGAENTKRRHDGEGLHVSLVCGIREEELGSKVVNWINEQVL